MTRPAAAPIATWLVSLCFLATSASTGVAAVSEVTPAQWLAAQPKPAFRPGHTLPPLTRWGWVLPVDARVELAEHWGYALEFGGYATDAVVDRALKVPASDEGKMLALAARDPRRYPLCVIVSRDLPAHPPPGTWTRDAAGRLLPSADKPDWSPEAPAEAIREAAELRARPLRRLREKAPIAIVLNGGEYALGVLGFSKKYWEQDPRVLAAKGNTDWFEYISRRKGEMETVIADACRRAVPDRRLYIYYTPGGGIYRNRSPGWEDWAWGYDWMRGVSDLPSDEFYYDPAANGWTGGSDLLTEALNVKGYELKFHQPFSYDWLNGGSLDESKLPPPPRTGRTTMPEFDPAGRLSDIRLYAGFLKCVYTAGTTGGVAGYFNLPPGGFGRRFPPDRPPHWLLQMTALAHVHALFSFQEPFVRASDLLPGPDRHRWSKDQPAYEFPTEPGVRVLARKDKTRPEWLITAWAADGRARYVTCKLPELGEVGLQARPEGSVYFISLAGPTPRVQWQDRNVVIPGE